MLIPAAGVFICYNGSHDYFGVGSIAHYWGGVMEKHPAPPTASLRLSWHFVDFTPTLYVVFVYSISSFGGSDLHSSSFGIRDSGLRILDNRARSMPLAPLSSPRRSRVAPKSNSPIGARIPSQDLNRLTIVSRRPSIYSRPLESPATYVSPLVLPVDSTGLHTLLCRKYAK